MSLCALPRFCGDGKVEEEGSFIIKHKNKQLSEFPSCLGGAVALEERALLAFQPQTKQEQCNEDLPCGVLSASGTQVLGSSGAGGHQRGTDARRAVAWQRRLRSPSVIRSGRSVTSLQRDPTARCLRAGGLSPPPGGLGRGKCGRRSRICLSASLR